MISLNTNKNDIFISNSLSYIDSLIDKLSTFYRKGLSIDDVKKDLTDEFISFLNSGYEVLLTQTDYRIIVSIYNSLLYNFNTLSDSLDILIAEKSNLLELKRIISIIKEDYNNYSNYNYYCSKILDIISEIEFYIDKYRKTNNNLFYFELVIEKFNIENILSLNDSCEFTNDLKSILFVLNEFGESTTLDNLDFLIMKLTNKYENFMLLDFYID